MAQGVLFSLYIGIGAKFENTQKTIAHHNALVGLPIQQRCHMNTQ